MEIELPWFDPILMPNRNRGVFWGSTYRAREDQKTAAYFLAIESLQREKISFVAPLMLGVTFYPPDKRRRDKDGCLSAIKSALDGVALALKIDDYHFSYSHIRFGEPVKGGKIMINIT